MQDFMRSLCGNIRGCAGLVESWRSAQGRGLRFAKTGFHFLGPCQGPCANCKMVPTTLPPTLHCNCDIWLNKGFQGKPVDPKP